MCNGFMKLFKKRASACQGNVEGFFGMTIRGVGGVHKMGSPVQTPADS